MKDNKLIPMVDYVLSKEHFFTPLDQDRSKSILIKRMRKCINYAEFLQTPLTLGMFIPCDEKGEVLYSIDDLRCIKESFCQCGEEQAKDCREWKREFRKGEENLLFEGFKLIKSRRGHLQVSNKTMTFSFDEYGCYLEPYDSVDGLRVNCIEVLTTNKVELTLTESAIKKYNI